MLLVPRREPGMDESALPAGYQAITKIVAASSEPVPAKKVGQARPGHHAIAGRAGTRRTELKRLADRAGCTAPRSAVALPQPTALPTPAKSWRNAQASDGGWGVRANEQPLRRGLWQSCLPVPSAAVERHIGSGPRPDPRPREEDPLPLAQAPARPDRPDRPGAARPPSARSRPVHVPVCTCLPPGSGMFDCCGLFGCIYCELPDGGGMLSAVGGAPAFG
jgi:hypothetical protein